MEIGFINFNTAEKKRIAKLMQQLMESEAIEELGIGRVRDHFSNTLFSRMKQSGRFSRKQSQ